MSKRKWYPIIAFGLLALAILMCNGEEEAEKVGEVGETSETQAEATAPSFFKVGDIVEKGGQRVTLNGCSISGDLLVCDFTIEAIGDESVNVSTLFFSARDDDGFDLDSEIFDCEKQIGGEIAPGDKMRGNICFKGGSLPAKVYYEAGLFTDAIVFEITE
jgi:hypothetical protein